MAAMNLGKAETELDMARFTVRGDFIGLISSRGETKAAPSSMLYPLFYFELHSLSFSSVALSLLMKGRSRPLPQQ